MVCVFFGNGRGCGSFGNCGVGGHFIGDHATIKEIGQERAR